MVDSRFDFIDWAKGIAICLICLGHFLPEGDTLKVVLYSFHVPVFFVMTGFLYKRDASTKSFMGKLAVRVILPYAFYFILSVVFSILFINSVPEFTKFFFINGVTIWNFPLWFMPVIFFGSVIFGLYHRIFKTNLSVVLLCLVSFAGAIAFDLNNVKEVFPFGFNKVLMMLGFYSLGVLLRLIFNRVKAFSIKTNIIALFVFITFCVDTGLINTGNNISLMRCDYNNILFYIPAAIVGSISFILIFVNLKSNVLILSLAKNTIFIMSTHYFLLYLWRQLGLTAQIAPLIGGLSAIALYVIILSIVNRVNIPGSVSKLTGVFSIRLPLEEKLSDTGLLSPKEKAPQASV